jgi:alkanesulfonate monooxygenase
MSVEFIGYISSQNQSEIHPAKGPVIDHDHVIRAAQAHEIAGFDRALIAHHSNAPDAVLLGAFAAAHTRTLKFMIAHRPGFVAPTYAARLFATFDQLSGGRASIHIISGGSDTEQQADGDFEDHAARYRRTDEWLRIVRQTWTSEKPFDHEGPFFKLRGGFSKVKSVQQPHIPIFFGGASDIAIEVAGRHADIYALWGEPLEPSRELISRVRASAAKAGRDPGAIRFSLSLRPIVAGTEEGAWRRADRILERIRDIRGESIGKGSAKPQSEGSRRLLEAAAGGRVRDQRLWTEVAAAVGAGANTTALVGTPEQVAESLLAYHAIGVNAFLIRGFDPIEDALDYGRDLIPLVRAQIARGALAEAAE